MTTFTVVFLSTLLLGVVALACVVIGVVRLLAALEARHDDDWL